MGIRNSVFGSKSEREVFKAIKSEWGKEYNIWHNLPFAQIIDFADLELTRAEKEYLLKTSIDFTLCTKDDKPILSIEFDGLTKGFSKGGEFIETSPYPEAKNRKWKMDTKLKFCRESNYPLFVVSYAEKIPIVEKIKLTIVDSIIGQALAKRHFIPTISKAVEEQQEFLDGLPPDEQQDYIQDLVISVEVDLEFEHDPVTREVGLLETKARTTGYCSSYQLQYLTDPELPIPRDLFDVETLKKRVEAYEKLEKIGCKITAKTYKGDISETAWMRYVSGYGVSPEIIVENIVKLILFHNLISGKYEE